MPGFLRENPLTIQGSQVVAKPGRQIKKANHGKRPASSKARKSKRKAIRT
jgi:hypothetical protein